MKKSDMKKSNTVKYFTQKNWGAAEIACVIIAVISFIVATFVWGGGPIGMPLLGIAVLVLIILKSSKVKAAEIDRELEKLIEEASIDSTSKNLIKTFDFKSEYLVKDKGEWRSSVYVISEIELLEENTLVTVHRIDLLAKRILKESYTLRSDDKISLVEENLVTKFGNKTIYYLASDFFSSNIPVCVNDSRAYEIVNKLCKN